MTRGMQELPLSGGRTTDGVVRVGETVRRPPKANSAFVQRLLVHLERRGFHGAPRYIGKDEDGRDTLSYLEGSVPGDLGWFEDGVLIAAARLISRYHAATAGFYPQGLAPPDFEVVCHNDLSPCNAVFSGGLPVALIDFDAAAPGARTWDLGYAAWLWLDIGNDDLTRGEQIRRLRLFVSAYGPGAAPQVVSAMIRRQQLLVQADGDAGRTAWAANCLAWTLE
ncbi:MAG TPA: phosphotransferase, partial [Vicinamibacterales bacterium]|nr:phosphotransferase [Vicinamibacterales bacterium]